MALKSILVAASMTGLMAQAASAFEVSSPEIAPGATIDMKQVFNGFGCKGGNVSPALNWSGAPEGTKSFAVLMHDPDAPTGGAGFWHWVVVNIPASAKGLPAGTNGKGDGMPAGALQINTDFGAPGYGGPCPPPGAAHHYNITVYALKVDKLDLPPTATASLTGFMVNANALGKATLTGLFGQ